MHHRNAFTLIELLVVIAIIAILSVVVILTLNPAQLLEQGRDSNRISDMSTLNSALGIYLAQGGSSLGNANTVYVSIPDPTATTTAGDQCQGLGLISLPSTYSYHCAASSTFKNVNGQGWIPVNFTSLAAGSPLGSLPTDPTNTSSSREYYTYDTNGSQYEVTMVPESQKYQLGGSNDVISNDGGTLASVYEKGSRLGLEPLDYGDPTLVGWWNFNEGNGSIAYDYSGNNATGSWSGTQAGTNGYYSAGEGDFPWAGYFNGSSSNDYVNVPVSFTSSVGVTFTAWVYPTNVTNIPDVVHTSSADKGLILQSSSGFPFEMQTAGLSNVYLTCFSGGGSILNTWNYLVGTWDGATTRVYFDGVLCGSQSAVGTLTFSNINIGARSAGSQYTFPGLIDDVRIYNHALSATQIASMYAGGK
jgi:prepilin-type N-terminal cleavage/methylation domain-containing protein